MQLYASLRARTALLEATVYFDGVGAAAAPDGAPLAQVPPAFLHSFLVFCTSAPFTTQ